MPGQGGALRFTSVSVPASWHSELDAGPTRCFFSPPNETHVSAPQPAPRAHTRLSRSHGNERWPKSAREPQAQGSPAPGGRHLQEVNAGPANARPADVQEGAARSQARGLLARPESGKKGHVSPFCFARSRAAGSARFASARPRGHEKSRKRRRTKSHQARLPRVLSDLRKFPAARGRSRCDRSGRRPYTRARWRAQRVGTRSGAAHKTCSRNSGGRSRSGACFAHCLEISQITVIARLLIAIVRLYQRLISPVLVLFFGRACRFEPSCSRYAVACLEMHGAWKGSLLSLVRLCKCQPFHPGGVDPPPPPRTPPLVAVASERSTNGP